jgi:hypothetical protein
MYRKFDVTENLFFSTIHFSMELNTAPVCFGEFACGQSEASGQTVRTRGSAASRPFSSLFCFLVLAGRQSGVDCRQSEQVPRLFFFRFFACSFPSVLNYSPVPLGHHQRCLAIGWLVNISFLRAFALGIAYKILQVQGSNLKCC